MKTIPLSLALLLAVSSAFAEASKSTLADQKEVTLTVYNNNLGLVKDTRGIKIPAGQGELQFMDVAAFIMPSTVHISSNNEAFKVLEQNYEYDLMSAEKVLDKYEGKQIKLVNWNDYQDRVNTVEATLLSNQAQIFKVNDEIYLGYPGTKVVPEIPNNLISRPTLSWLYENSGAEEQTLEVTYLTSNISWAADYVAVLNEDDSQLDLSGWVTLDNKSGASYENAQLKLIAGEINRAAQPEMYAQQKVYGARMAMADNAFQEKAFFEYHLYDLDRKTTVKNNQTKQISLLQASNVGTRKEYIVRGEAYYFFGQYASDNPKVPVQIYMTFQNKKENNLGMPLPAGTVRVYKKDTDGARLFIGEDRIEHTPTDEEIRLKLGEAFDVMAERVQSNYQTLTSRSHLSDWEITLKNRKNQDIVVAVLEPMTGDWKISNSNFPAQKKDAFTAKFEIPVVKRSEVKLTYRVVVQS